MLFLVAVVAVIGVVLATVPVSQTRLEWFTIYNPGSSATWTGVRQTFPESGELSFHWQASSISGVNLTVVGPSGSVLYSTVDQTGSARFAVVAGSPYLFSTYTPVPESVEIDGVLEYAVPLI